METELSPQESTLREAVNMAEVLSGPKSASVGLTLITLAEFLDNTGRSNEASDVTERYREIVVGLARSHGLAK